MFSLKCKKGKQYLFILQFTVCCVLLLFLYIDYYMIDNVVAKDNVIINDISTTSSSAVCSNIYNEYHAPRWKEMVKLRNDFGYNALSCNNMENSNKIVPFRIFQIGFHRAGTRSLYEFFTSNSYGSAHYQCKYDCSLDVNNKQKCDLLPCFRIMIDNYQNSKLLLDGLCHEYVYYGDFGISPEISTYLQYDIQFDILHDKYKNFWFEILDKQYLCSKFILNIRPLNDWLLSRSEHKAKYIKNSKAGNGNEINQYWQLHSFFYFRPFQDRNKTNWNQDLTKEEVFKYWTRDWFFYNCYVINYFKSRNRMNDLLIFDIQNDDIQKLMDFFGDKEIKLNLDSVHWKHTNWKHNTKQFNNSLRSASTEPETDRLLKIC